MHGYFPYGIITFQLLHVAVVGGGLYLLYSISKSLKQIANSINKRDNV